MSKGERLKEWIVAKHGSAANFAERYKLNKGNLSLIINNRRVLNENILMILINEGCDIRWLYTGKGFMNYSDNFKQDNSNNVLELNDILKLQNVVSEIATKYIANAESSKKIG